MLSSLFVKMFNLSKILEIFSPNDKANNLAKEFKVTEYFNTDQNSESSSNGNIRVIVVYKLKTKQKITHFAENE